VSDNNEKMEKSLQGHTHFCLVLTYVSRRRVSEVGEESERAFGNVLHDYLMSVV
jgi:hypothetical protein